MKKICIVLLVFILGCSKDATEAIPPINKYNLTVVSSLGGTVSSSGGKYNEGQSLSISAIPEANYEFTGWSGDVTGDENPLTISVDRNLTFTANFSIVKYLLDVDVVGQGNVNQQILSPNKTTPTEYDGGTPVGLEAIADDNWLFYTWSGSSTSTEAEIELVIESSQSITATFEEQLNLSAVDISARVGRWKIRKPKTRASKTTALLNQAARDVCEIYEIIFRSDGTFTMVSAVGTNSGSYIYEEGTTISLTQAGQAYARYEDVVMTNSYISFRLILGACDQSISGDKDYTYNEADDPITGTVTETTTTTTTTTVSCTISGGLSSGPVSQTVNTGYEISQVSFTFSNSCSETFSITSTGLPPGISIMEFVNEGGIDVQGTVSEDASGIYDYSITASNSSSVYTVTGTIEVENTSTECTSASLNVLEGVLDQTISEGNPIQTIRIQLDTDCPDNDNGVPLNSAGDNFPNGVSYSFDGVNNQVIISGTPTTVGTHTYTLIYYNGETINSSTVSTSISGTIVVSGLSTNTNSSTNSAVYFENGICKCPNATEGETAIISETTYTVVDNS
ncbi:MAG: InlB B-repeat-containing protein, partial [Flavobacteriaceae bacterium]